VTRPVTIELARKVFLRACASLHPADWDAQETILRTVDARAWEIVVNLAMRHGLLGLVARNLDWAHARTGVPISILNRARAWRQGHLAQMLVYRKAARRITEAMAARGVRFVLFKGMALVELVYRDLSLRTFRDCDILVERDHLETAYAILREFGYSPAQYASLQEYLVRDNFGANMRHSDGSSVDLHWAIQGYEMRPSDPEIIWRCCQAPGPSQELPGWRMSPELTLINLASHFQVHEYEEIKPLVDFYLTAVTLGERIDIDQLRGKARALGMVQTVDLAARLCKRLFPQNPMIGRLAAGSPSPHKRLALGVLTDASLLRLDKIRPTERRLRGLICYGVISLSAKAFRKMLIPKARELEVRFGRRFNFCMYPRYYMVQAYRLLARSRKPFSDLA
jgi:hypothetical protein